MYISHDKQFIIRSVSVSPVAIAGQSTIKTAEQIVPASAIGKRLVLGPLPALEKLKIALVCNWGDRCGIATYSKLLADAWLPKVKALGIFAEYLSFPAIDPPEVVRCWKRGESLVELARQIQQWKPDVVLIQHEFGIFPKATHFLKLLEMLDSIPYAITLHSVYEHLDKTICTSYIRDAIVHSEAAKASLIRGGHLNDVHVILHGCVQYPETSELWNIFQNDYAIIQFGFGFEYKGIEMAIDAISLLKKTNAKFKNIFYCCLCTENEHTQTIHQEYYGKLIRKVKDLELMDNIAIMRGFLSEKHLCNFMRTAKLAIFPYRSDSRNVVYSASGAIRNALANSIPTVASDCHHFDEFEGILPRPSNHIELAAEIDKVFSDAKYRSCLAERGKKFVLEHGWGITADLYLDVLRRTISKYAKNDLQIANYEQVVV